MNAGIKIHEYINNCNVMYERMIEWIKRLIEKMNVVEFISLNEWMKGWMLSWMYEWLTEWVNEWMLAWMNDIF